MWRLGAAFVVMLAMALNFHFSSTLAMILFIGASITDYWDGRLARTKYGVTTFGKLMDPLADKILVCAALVGFVGIRLPYEPLYSLVPAWVVVIVVAREFAVTGLRLLAASEEKQEIIIAGPWGKWKTAWQMIAIIATFLMLSIRIDFLPYFDLSAKFLRQYDGAFVVTSWVLSTTVAVITVISGWKYFSAHWELVTKDM